MDGKRVQNKEKRNQEFDVDVSLIRDTFKEACEREGYRVIQLTAGEGELQMYLQRDKSTNLNVFFTKDSDMLSILYGHAPIVTGKASVVKRAYPVADAYTNVIDQNDDYDKCVEVYDSCAWIECESNNKPMRIYGFDDTVNRLKFSKLVFRTFCAMCGTDFTDPLLTPSMITGFFTCIRPDELAMVNGYEMDLLDCTIAGVGDNDGEGLDKTVWINRIFEIVTLVLLSGFRNKGNVKQMKKPYETGKLRDFKCLKTELYGIVRAYYVYISLGVMLPVEIPRLKNVAHNYIKTIVHVCRDGPLANYQKPTTALALYNWSIAVTLDDCLKNCIDYENRFALAPPGGLEKIKRKLSFTDDKESVSKKHNIMNLDYRVNLKKYLKLNGSVITTRDRDSLLDAKPIHFMDNECRSMVVSATRDDCGVKHGARDHKICTSYDDDDDDDFVFF
ncbi:uncharacterized protein LOC112593917 [Melanaphis sacchari]|uniref:uncharacterized protein LOC112593917 n=1 Tax=Melanaphis sacchari TaxID=742174 RepID=UPI000DC12E37|nr:uncharacterized protein LOC112593917 [Melanaphis sacchari]